MSSARPSGGSACLGAYKLIAHSRSGLGLVLAYLLLLAGCGAGAPALVPQGGPGTVGTPSYGELAWSQEVLALTNGLRAEHGLPLLVLDERASSAAYEHSWDMDLRDYFDHTNPDGEGPSDRLARVGVAFRDSRENLARGQASPQEVMQAWMDSPVHRANLLYPGWTHIGIGVHSGPSNGPWWAQEFFR